MKNVCRYMAVMAGCCLMSACASIDYNTTSSKGLLYFEPQPVLLVTNTADCKQEVSVLSIPGETKRLLFKPGYGSSEMSVTLTNGMIGTASQTVDTKLPETFGLFGAMREGNKPAVCTTSSTLYKIVNGQVSSEAMFRVPPPTRQP